LHKFGSMPALLANFFPDFDWLPWKFSLVPRNYWDDVNNQRKFMDWVAKELNISDMNGWYNITNKVTTKLICQVETLGIV
jgi:hypothetical protein